jgi:hypothetical protein
VRGRGCLVCRNMGPHLVQCGGSSSSAIFDNTYVVQRFERLWVSSAFFTAISDGFLYVEFVHGATRFP